MIRLYGYPISNFYNKVKLALLEKGLPFQEERTAPNRSDANYLATVPTGRIPYLEHDSHILFESTVILEYLEEAFPDSLPLMPKDPWQRAQVRMLVNIVDLHIDPPARKLYGLLRGEDVPLAVEEKALPELKFGIDALGRMTHFSPFIAGDMFTTADCAALATLPLVEEIYQALGIPNELSRLRGYQDYLSRMKERPPVKKVLRGMKAARRGLAMTSKGL